MFRMINYRYSIIRINFIYPVLWDYHIERLAVLGLVVDCGQQVVCQVYTDLALRLLACVESGRIVRTGLVVQQGEDNHRYYQVD